MPFGSNSSYSDSETNKYRKLAKLLKLKNGEKVMLTVNSDRHNCLVNGHMVIIS